MYFHSPGVCFTPWILWGKPHIRNVDSISRPIQFTLVVDYFGVKYTIQKDAEHLLGILDKEFTAVSTDWDGALYCGITLEWTYEESCLDIYMPVYIKKLLQK